MSETMTEIEVYNSQEETMQREERDNDEENVGSMMQNETFLIDLNLVMIIASLSMSDQEISEVQEMEKLNVQQQQQEQDVKTFVSKLNGRKRVFDDLKIPDRRGTRLQPRILDSRHGRKM